MDYYRRSIDVILQNQHPGGAFIASPTFSNYQYCWLRDGSFVAYAMDRTGQHQSAVAFFRWVDRVINRYAYKVEQLEQQVEKTQVSPGKSYLFTRYTLEGEEESADSLWGNFQIDGYGTWLWALAEHVRITGDKGLLTEFSQSIAVTLRYLRAAWQLPNYDCWEEHPEFLHPYSLSAVYGGLKAAADLVQSGDLAAESLAGLPDPAVVKEFLCRNAVVDHKFVKHVSPVSTQRPARPVENSGVDSSLLGLAIPFQVFDLDDPLILSTLEAIEADLHRPGGGVYRYKGDVYYGGGEWLLLSAWLGWTLARCGEKDRAGELLSWIERNTDSDGNMPEQVNKHMLAPAEFPAWVKRWGPVATPLMWSHAMYLILFEELR